MGSSLDSLPLAETPNHLYDSSHAGGAPWEGVNALDAAVLAWAMLATPPCVCSDASAQVQ